MAYRPYVCISFICTRGTITNKNTNKRRNKLIYDKELAGSNKMARFHLWKPGTANARRSTFDAGLNGQRFGGQRERPQQT